MKKYIYLLFVLLFFNKETILAQNQDSINFVQAKWTVKKIQKGVFLKQYHFQNNLFNSSQYINIVVVKNKRKHKFGIAYEPRELKHTSSFGINSNALVAINGSFFDTKNGGSVDFLKVAGQLISHNTFIKNNRLFHQKAAILIEKGKLNIAKWDSSSTWENTLNSQNVMLTGPLLIFNNNLEPLEQSAFANNRHPRSAIAQTRNTTLLITVDGRNKNALGMSLVELSKIMAWLGAKDAINLDGGGSTTLWVSGQPENGVVNYPSDNKQWDHKGERKVANALILSK